MEDRETERMRKYGESKTTRIMMATVPHVTSGLGLTKFQADGFLLTRVYLLYYTSSGFFFFNICTTGSSISGAYNSTTFLIVTHMWKSSRALTVCSCFICFCIVIFNDAVKHWYRTALMVEERIRVWRNGGMTLTEEYKNIRGDLAAVPICPSSVLILALWTNPLLRYCYVSFPLKPSFNNATIFIRQF